LEKFLKAKNVWESIDNEKLKFDSVANIAHLESI